MQKKKFMNLKHLLLVISLLYGEVYALGQCESFCGFYSGLKKVGGVCSDLAGTPDELALTNCCNFPGVTCDSSTPDPVITR
ncbi:hypothetical protein HDV02_004555, partial [Globomyces sp. JEL0801]